MGRSLRLLILLVAALLACGGGGPSYRRVAAPDGGPLCGLLECKSLAECYEAAGELCPRGYRVLDGEQHQEIKTVPNLGDAYQASAQKRPVQQVVVTKNHVTMLFRCTNGTQPSGEE
jgi:hypothetical protein